MESSNDVTVIRKTTKQSFETRTPISQSRTVLITRSAPGTSPVNSATIRAESHRSSFMAPANSRNLVNTGVSKFLEGRGKEKKDMQELNQRFGNYIEKTRFLEAQNRKLAKELKDLQDRWGIETKKVKQMYETEMQQLRKLLDESDRAKAELQVQVSTLEDREVELEAIIEDLRAEDAVHRETIDKLHSQINDLENELAILRRRVSKFDEERAKDKKEMDRLRNEIQRLRKDLDSETLAHINAENEAQSLRDQLEFIKEVHEAELKELSSLAYRDTTAENRNFWRAELSQALQEIQSEYDSKVETIKSDLESVYTLRMQEIRTNNTRGSLENTHIKEENKRVKALLNDLRDKVPLLEAKIANLEAQLADLQHELEEERRDHDLDNERLNDELLQTKNELAAVVDEVQVLLDAKLSLELEIVAYRKLLDGEESRKSNKRSAAAEKSRLDQVLPPLKTPKPLRDDQMGAEPVIEGEISAKSQSAAFSAPSNGVALTATQHSSSSSSSSSVMAAKSMQRQTIIRGEVSARTVFQRTTKGDITIKECAIDGTHIVLENTAMKKQDIGRWTLKRVIDDGEKTVTYTLPNATLLDIGLKRTLTIWAKGCRPKDSKDLEIDDKSWGIASRTAVTALLNEKGEERATNTARTSYGENHDH